MGINPKPIYTSPARRDGTNITCGKLRRSARPLPVSTTSNDKVLATAEFPKLIAVPGGSRKYFAYPKHEENTSRERGCHGVSVG
jgi:hypothetical protein